ncbi:uncharacterized protein SPSK_02887 [Sporothrix schenckii 1099-18]|uniref:Uncharacterized protein n=1 Tax=Sporothrix schenckii 1099-18 TaxID=1397361 RepID=A0A0F2MAT0_SPOSC|nr:uncharacterized protein SPSK_02887 [Sporothrix schenckii 1099-18]KJR86747.1 hypothetical protein SPSK_02887 [Sporothrix schenckii 1099-18]
MADGACLAGLTARQAKWQKLKGTADPGGRSKQANLQPRHGLSPSGTWAARRRTVTFVEERRVSLDIPTCSRLLTVH